jgi:creatinine amidohydrolase
MLDARNTSKEIEEGLPEIAVFGVGAVEQHSIHLPLGTDWLGVKYLSQKVAEALDAFLAPALPFSMSECHGPMAGTVWLRPETLAAVLRDTVLSLQAQGFRKVLVVNGHGGNFVLEAEVRRLNREHPGLIVLQVPPIMAPRPGDPRIWDKGVGIHAGERETASHLHINPELVKDERIDYLPPVGREFLDYAFVGFISEWGVWGYPTYATAEKGEQAAALRIERIATWAVETFARVEALRKGEEG